MFLRTKNERESEIKLKEKNLELNYEWNEMG